MNIPDQLKFSIKGFSGKRVGYVFAVMSFALVPVHFAVDCRVSGAIALMSFVLFLITGILSFFNPRGTVNRFLPLGLTLLGAVAHTLFMH